MTRVEGERIAVLETKMDTVLDRMDKTDANMASFAAKLDTIIAGQAAGATDRKAIREEIAAMKPDVATVAEIKRLGRVGKYVIGTAAAFMATFIAAKDWIVLNWNWLISR